LLRYILRPFAWHCLRKIDRTHRLYPQMAMLTMLKGL